jgi:hypothetical protein
MATLQIPVPKAEAFVDFDIDEFMDESGPYSSDVVKAVIREGVKHYLNLGMSKITGAKTDASREKAMEVAMSNLQKLKDGNIRMAKGVRTKGAGRVKTEALRLARLLVKDALKRQGEKVSHYAAKEITVAAQSLLDGEQGPDILTQAEANLKAREEKELSIDISMIKPDAELVKKAEAKTKRTRAVVLPTQVRGRAQPQARQ